MLQTYFIISCQRTTLRSSIGKAQNWAFWRIRHASIQLLLLIAFGFYPSVLHAQEPTLQEPSLPITIGITLNEKLPVTKNQVNVTMELIPSVAVKSIKASFDVTKNLSLNGRKDATIGQLNKGVKYNLTTTVSLRTNGRAILTGTFEVVTMNGNKFTTSRSLYFLVNKGNSYFSTLGFIGAQSDSIKYKLRSARLTPDGFETEYRKALQKIISVTIPASTTSKHNTDKTVNSNKGSQLVTNTFTVSGTINWTAPDGTTYPVKIAPVEIWDNKLNRLLAETITDAAGFYSKSVTGDNPDIYIKILAKSAYFFIVPQGSHTDESATYFVQSTPVSSVTTNMTVSITIPNSLGGMPNATYNAFSVHSALVESAEYVRDRNGSALAKLPVEFPGAGTASFFHPGIDKYLNILFERRFAWDVIHHEYGHYVANTLTLEGSSLGGSHGPADNLAEPPRGKQNGLVLAWSEGWPTYFGTSLQQSRGLNIPSVGAGDSNYDNMIGLVYSLESQSLYPSIGEDNEVAVQRIIWDLFDGVDSGEKDDVSLGDAVVWQTIKNRHPEKLYDIWEPFTAGKPLSEVVKYGAIFAEHKVASLPKQPTDKTMLTTLKDPVAFTWDANGAGPSFKSNKFTVEFYSKDFSKLLFTSPEQTTPSFTATSDNLKKIFTTESEVKWLVKSSNTSTPVTGPYTSPAFTLSATPSGADVVFVVDDTGSMGEEINGVKQGIIQYLASFTTAPGSTSATVFQLVTFKDAPNTSRAATSDLNIIRSQVAALVASGGDDCPEGSIEAMLATDALVKDGGEVRLYTDADPHPGQTKESVVALYSKRGVKQSTILSGMCTSSPAAAAYEKEKGIIIPVSDNDSEKAPRATDPTSGVSTTDSAIEAYSFIAQETGGTFVFFPEVNSGNPADLARYTNLVFNLLVGSISSAVTLIEPYTGPVGSTFMLTITGTKTNFNASSAVSFVGTGITVGTPTILSATKIVVPITIAPSTTLGLKDITIVTTLADGGTETAKGVGLFTVTAAPSTPTIVGITPVSGSTGQTLTVTVSGLNTHFTNNSVLTIGSGITVLSSTALSQGQLEAQIRIADNAVVGFRDVSVKTGSEVATENVTGPFLVTAAGCTPITIASVTVPSGGTATLTASGCAGTLLWSTGAGTSSIIVGPLTSSTAVSATCTTGSCVVSALGTVTVLPATGGTFALTAPTYNCTTGAITFNTSGGDGSPIEYFAIGITNWSANPNQFVEPGLRTDRKVILLKARQKGVEVSYTFDMPAFCAGGTPVGKLALLAPTYNCTTGAITFNTSGGDGSLIEYFAIGITNWSTNANQTIDRELRADPKTVELKARQGGVLVSYIFDLPAACPPVPVPPSGKLALLAPTYNCTTGAITFNTSGGDGSLIEYFAIGITNWSASPNQFVEPGLRTDRKVIVLKARQKGVEVSYTFDMPTFCAGARLSVAEPGAGLQLRVLGNPLEGKAARIVISGVTGQAVQLMLVNTQGQVLYQHTIEHVLADEQVNVPTQSGQGLLLLQVSTERERQQIKLLKH